MHAPLAIVNRDGMARVVQLILSCKKRHGVTQACKKRKGRKDGKKEKDKKKMFKCILVLSHVIVDGYVVREDVAVAFKESHYFV